MKAWLSEKFRPVVSLFEFQIVFNQEQATLLTGHKAGGVMRGAEQCYTEYTWAVVEAGDMFIVEGTERKK